MLDILREYEYCIGIKKEGWSEYCFLYPNKRYWYADPIPATINGVDYLFVEAYDKYEGKGKIAVTVLSDLCTRPKIIIDESFHMSFPNVFFWNGSYYMLPETNDANQIRLYKMQEDVFNWCLISYMDVKDRKYTDIAAVILNDELFFVAGEKDPNDRFKCRTVIMKVNSLEGELGLEIVGEKAEYSYDDRNAGTPFWSDGELFRSIQHSDSNTYGKYVTIHKFEELSDSCDQRSVVRTIDIDSEGIHRLKGCIPYGIHTYGKICGWEVIDVGVKRLSLDGLFVKIIRRLPT